MEKDFSCQKNKKLVLKEKCKTHLIAIDKITHLTCEGPITKIHTIENDDIIVSKLLKYFEIELAEQGFIRANHNTIVNLSKIDCLQTGKKRSVVLNNGIEVDISRHKMRNFRLNENNIKEIQNFVDNINNDYPIEFNGYAKQDEYLTDNISSKKKSFQKRAKCTGNIENFYILPDGKVTICEELYWHKDFIIGDLSRQSIEQVWNSKKALNLYNLSQEMIQKSSACKTCSEFDECHKVPGVCWKLVIEAYGSENWDYPDPKCFNAPDPFYTIS